MNEFRYISDKLRITTRSDPARGGKRVECMTHESSRTILLPEGIRKEMTKRYWKDIGTVMDAPTNVVREQPKSLAQKLVERMAERQDKIIMDAVMGRTASDFLVDTAGNCEDVRNG